MTLHRPTLWVTTVVTVAVVLSACSGGSVSTAAKPSPSSTASLTSAPTPTSAVTPTNTKSPTTGLRAADRRHTVVELKSALIKLEDLPSGYAIEPASGGGDGGGSASSKDPRCAPFVKLSNVKTAPGSTASASSSFSGGQEGPFVDESIDAMGSAEAAMVLQAAYKAAVGACGRVTLTIPGQGSSTVKVVEVSAPKFGEHTFAARMTAASGPLAGLEITQVIAGVQDVVVSLTFVAASPDDVDGGTEAAVGKAADVLRTGASGT